MLQKTESSAMAQPDNIIGIGSSVPILVHICRRLKQLGVVTQMSDEGLPIVARCITCQKSVAVDLKAFRESQELQKQNPNIRG